VPYPIEGASNRFRVEQYIPYLEGLGISCAVKPFVSSRFYRILYLKGHFAQKIFHFILCTISRAADTIRAMRYDVIFIHREFYPVGPPIMERLFKLCGKKVVFDFDDAIFLLAASEPNLFMERFNRYGKVPEVISIASQVIAGNSYLADFALNYNENIYVIPTPVDVKKYKPATKNENSENIVIGWIGSKTTSCFLEILRDVFRELLDKYSNLTIRIIGGSFNNEACKRIECIPWELDNEVKMLQGFDIGIMPMPDTRWTRGKCAFKAILYMSVGIPCISSSVGMNSEVVKDGINGFLANDAKEWKDKLSMLIESSKLRKEIGKAGRETIVARYSTEVNFPRFLEVIKKAEKNKIGEIK